MISVSILGRSVLLATVLGFGVAPVLAQGTAAQREACTPDAVRLCTDTIPDVGRTTACMRAHRAELSAGCQAAFDAKAPSARPHTRRARSIPVRSRPHVTSVAAVRTHVQGWEVARRSRGDRDTRAARRVIGRMCGVGLVDAGTCGFMGRVLSLAD